MAKGARDEPLRAEPRFSATPTRATGAVPPGRSWDDPEPEAATTADHRTDHRAGELPSRARSALLGVGVGLAVLVAGVALAFSIVAIPLYLLASTDPGHGLDRDLVRKGLFYVALPFGAVSGLVGGVVVGAWYGRGGRLPHHDPEVYAG